MGIPTDSRFYVPGNHDVSWTTTGDRFINIQNENEFDVSFSNSTGDLFSGHHLNYWETDQFIVIGLNSSWNHTAIDHGFGSISNESLNELSSILSQINSPNKISIVTLHHHPYNYNPLVKNYGDPSALINADDLMDRLQQYKVDLLIHGHKHVPQFTYNMNNGAHPLVVLGAGSLSAILPSAWQGDMANHFHIIDLDERGPRNSAIRGHIMNYRYHASSGWLPATEIHHCAPNYPFGSVLTQSEAEEALRTAIEYSFQKQPVVFWADCCEMVPELTYLPIRARTNAVKALRDQGLYSLLISEANQTPIFVKPDGST